MKITVSQLRRIIKEEIVRSHSINEGGELTSSGNKPVQINTSTAGKPSSLPPVQGKEFTPEQIAKSEERNQQMTDDDKKLKNDLEEKVIDTVELKSVSNGHVTLRKKSDKNPNTMDVVVAIKQHPEVKSVKFA